MTLVKTRPQAVITRTEIAATIFTSARREQRDRRLESINEQQDLGSIGGPVVPLGQIRKHLP
jgi:hypothetical protein